MAFLTSNRHALTFRKRKAIRTKSTRSKRITRIKVNKEKVEKVVTITNTAISTSTSGYYLVVVGLVLVVGFLYIAMPQDR